MTSRLKTLDEMKLSFGLLLGRMREDSLLFYAHDEWRPVRSAQRPRAPSGRWESIMARAEIARRGRLES